MIFIKYLLPILMFACPVGYSQQLSINWSNRSIDSPIIVTDISISNINCYKNTFNQNFILSKDSILNVSTINFCFFKIKSDFDYSVFMNVGDFSHDTFDYTVNFYSSFFRDEFIFSNSLCNSGFNASHCCFNKKTVLCNSIFNNKSEFNSTNFNDTVDFTNTHFDGAVTFQHITFVRLVDFSRSDFKGLLKCNDLLTGDNTVIKFDSTLLPDTLDFSSNYNLKSVIDLTTCISTINSNNTIKPHYINLYQTNISKFRLDYVHYKLLLLNPNTNKLLSEDDISIIYENLLKNFKDNGQQHSYSLLDIEYRDHKLGAWKITKYWNCYGYEKKMIFIWILIFEMIFTIITFFFFEKLNGYIWDDNYVYNLIEIESLSILSNPNKSFIKRILSKIWFSFIYTSIIFFLVKLDTEKIKFSKKGFVYIMIMYLTGIVCLGYLANFILQR